MANTLSGPTLLEIPGQLFETSSFCLLVSNHWGSDSPNYRQLIRASVREKLVSLDDNTPYSQILALEVLPTSEKHGISISHTQGMGGYLLDSGKRHIGLDIEPTSRVNSETWQRLMRQHPANSMFATAELDQTQAWTALEASFKASSQAGFAAYLNELIVSKWNVHESGYIDFEMSSVRAPVTSKVFGVTFKHSTFDISVAAIFS